MGYMGKCFSDALLDSELFYIQNSVLLKRVIKRFECIQYIMCCYIWTLVENWNFQDTYDGQLRFWESWRCLLTSLFLLQPLSQKAKAES